MRQFIRVAGHFGWVVPLGFGLWIVFDFSTKLIWFRSHLFDFAPAALSIGVAWLVAAITSCVRRRGRRRQNLTGADQSADNRAFDFLYVDGQRIARIQAQSDDMGLATQKSRELLDRASTEGEASVGSISVKGITETQSRNTAVFDPSWRIPVEFATQRAGHAFKKLDSASPGDIITISGSITLRDYEFLNAVLENEGCPEGSRRKLTKLPFLIHASVSEGQFRTWSTLNSACTTASTGDLALKYGANLPGTWTLIGVLDQGIDDTEPVFSGSEVDEIAEIARSRFGRPTGAIGITPLLIYRMVRI